MALISPVKVIPILNTRDVLLEHLSAQLIVLFPTKSRCKEVVIELSRDLQNQELIGLLEDEKLLIQTASKTKGYRREREELGEELFCKVSDIEPDLCSKITGMLLELDIQTIRKLLNNEDYLAKATEKAKEEYLIYAEESRKKDEIGEALYKFVVTKYTPDVASHLTGMLLELERQELTDLLNNKEELDCKLKFAYDVLIRYRSA